MLSPLLDAEGVLREVPELELGKNLEQGPFHHLDVLGHTLQVLEGVEEELEAGNLGACVPEERLDGLRFAGILHDVAKPLTRSEIDGRLLFVAHDSLGARMAFRVCARLGVPANVTDAATTLTALHLKIGFMHKEFSDYPPGRLAVAAGPFGEELAVLSWADRLGAQGERLKSEHIERHRSLCLEFLAESRREGPHPEPDYKGMEERLGLSGAELGYAASKMRLMVSRGVEEGKAVEVARRIALG
jgi:poly(A) polymerase